jgi:endonuclease YncB( thermonuclease family)
MFATLVATPAFPIDKCGRGQRVTCVIDGDTFWLDGVKYRTSGYDTPEPYSNICGGQFEQQLAARAIARFIALWNTTEITIRRTGSVDRYDRNLVQVYSNGQDIGEILITEGLARHWPVGHEFWCR